MKATVYNQEGEKTGDVTLPKDVFDVPWNSNLVHQVVVSMQSNARRNIAHTKDRSEVRGGGAKPWRQKGTGRARHGSIRSPIWAGGGITFGPRKEQKFDKKINKKTKAKALYAVLSQKMRDGEISFVESINFKEPKTKEALAVLQKLNTSMKDDDLLGSKKNAVLLVINEPEEAVKKSFSNFGNVGITSTRNINVVDLLTYKHVIIVDPKEAVSFFEQKLTKKKKEAKNTKKAAKK